MNKLTAEKDMLRSECVESALEHQCVPGIEKQAQKACGFYLEVQCLKGVLTATTRAGRTVREKNRVAQTNVSLQKTLKKLVAAKKRAKNIEHECTRRNA